MRRKHDGWVNATHILKVANFDKPQRTRILEKEVQKNIHEKIQGGYGKYQGTWVPIEIARQIATQYHVCEILEPLFSFIENENSPPPLAKHVSSAAKAKARLLAQSSNSVIGGTPPKGRKAKAAASAAGSMSRPRSAATSQASSRANSVTSAGGLATATSSVVSMGSGAENNVVPVKRGRGRPKGVPNKPKQNLPFPAQSHAAQAAAAAAAAALASASAQRSATLVSDHTQSSQQYPHHLQSTSSQFSDAREYPPAKKQRVDANSPNTSRRLALSRYNGAPGTTPGQYPNENNDRTIDEITGDMGSISSRSSSPSDYYSDNDDSSHPRIQNSVLGRPSPRHDPRGPQEVTDTPSFSKHRRQSIDPPETSLRSPSTNNLFAGVSPAQANSNSGTANDDNASSRPTNGLVYGNEAAAAQYSTKLLDYFMAPEGDDVPDALIHPPEGLDINHVIDDEGHTIFHWACAMGKPKIIEALLRAGANKSAVNLQGQTPLMRSIMFTNNFELRTFSKIVGLLIDTIFLQDNSQRTVLHHIADSTAYRTKRSAAKYYNEMILAKLAERESRDMLEMFINKQDSAGDTALHIAARNRARKCVKELLTYHASTTIPNKNGHTPEEYIQEYEVNRKKHARQSIGPSMSHPTPTQSSTPRYHSYQQPGVAVTTPYADRSYTQDMPGFHAQQYQYPDTYHRPGTFSPSGPAAPRNGQQAYTSGLLPPNDTSATMSPPVGPVFQSAMRTSIQSLGGANGGVPLGLPGKAKNMSTPLTQRYPGVSTPSTTGRLMESQTGHASIFESSLPPLSTSSPAEHLKHDSNNVGSSVAALVEASAAAMRNPPFKFSTTSRSIISKSIPAFKSELMKLAEFYELELGDKKNDAEQVQALYESIVREIKVREASIKSQLEVLDISPGEDIQITELSETQPTDSDGKNKDLVTERLEDRMQKAKDTVDTKVMQLRKVLERSQARDLAGIVQQEESKVTEEIKAELSSDTKGTDSNNTQETAGEATKPASSSQQPCDDEQIELVLELVDLQRRRKEFVGQILDLWSAAGVEQKMNHYRKLISLSCGVRTDEIDDALLTGIEQALTETPGDSAA